MIGSLGVTMNEPKVVFAACFVEGILDICGANSSTTSSFGLLEECLILVEFCCFTTFLEISLVFLGSYL